jgi:hypothetical protein
MAQHQAEPVMTDSALKVDQQLDKAVQDSELQISMAKAI